MKKLFFSPKNVFISLCLEREKKKEGKAYCKSFILWVENTQILAEK